ncbi:hypothetical protein [Spartinivicinus marinus]|uniref:hypothetical protein n=1 Tax=Spartinivicinus marinus TaxID=2994442 RepID=UPI0022522486|nr:hypothetical protein [Spartinivicinus marinus]MCX4030269.1 hypothetical protein [Spartinivicinus marinus]
MEATIAQDVCICVDAALQALCNKPKTSLIEYAFEPFRLSICYQKTGYLDVGSDGEEEFEQLLIKDHRILSEFKYQDEDLLFIQKSDGVSLDDIKKLKYRAEHNSWSLERLSVS